MNPTILDIPVVAYSDIFWSRGLVFSFSRLPTKMDWEEFEPKHCNTRVRIFMVRKLSAHSQMLQRSPNVHELGCASAVFLSQGTTCAGV